jgi:hypothetical protein
VTQRFGRWNRESKDSFTLKWERGQRTFSSFLTIIHNSIKNPGEVQSQFTTMFARRNKMMDYWDLGDSRRPEWRAKHHLIGRKSHHLKVHWEIGRTGPWGKLFGIWSGLSESNRHLKLGKVREVKSNALERRHLAILGTALIGK